MTEPSQVKGYHVAVAGNHFTYCDFCGQAWPCDSICLASELEEAQAKLRHYDDVVVMERPTLLPNGLAVGTVDTERLGVVLEERRMLRAENARLREDAELLDWLDTLPCGIVILGDASYPHQEGMTPKEPGVSHTRRLIVDNRARRGVPHA